MVTNPDLSGKNDPVTKPGTAGDADLAGDETVPADDDVVADVDMGVNSGAGADAGLAAGAGAGNRHKGADVDVILDDELAIVFGKTITFTLTFVAEAVTANDTARTDSTLGADCGAPENRDIGANNSIRADDHGWADDDKRRQRDTRSDAGSRTDGSGAGFQSGSGLLDRGEQDPDDLGHLLLQVFDSGRLTGLTL